MNKPPHKLMQNLAVNLAKRRHELGMSQNELAKLTHVNLGVISLLERTERGDVRLSTLHNLAKAMNCEIANLLYGFEKV